MSVGNYFQKDTSHKLPSKLLKLLRLFKATKTITFGSARWQKEETARNF